jgi:hypothetical protein
MTRFFYLHSISLDKTLIIWNINRDRDQYAYPMRRLTGYITKGQSFLMHGMVFFSYRGFFLLSISLVITILFKILLFLMMDSLRFQLHGVTDRYFMCARCLSSPCILINVFRV